MTARSVFLRDQNDAACADAAKALRDASEACGAPARERMAGPFAAELAIRLSDRCARGLQEMCEHLGDLPRVAVFMASRPERLLCRPCARPYAGELTAAVGAAACDVCRRDVARKPVAWAFGPLLLTYTACDGCFRAEVAG
jgi:hypothetical protein